MTNAELIKALSNKKKRLDFCKNYKSWGLWFKVPQLDDLEFYKFDFPTGDRLIALFFQSDSDEVDEEMLPFTNTLYFFRRAGEKFSPSFRHYFFTLEPAIKEIVKKLKEAKENDRDY